MLFCLKIGPLSSPTELPVLFAFDPEEDLVLLAGDGFPSRLGLSLDEVLVFVRQYHYMS